ncbi:hypothetical protein [Thermocoleostomius sinensis]|jgi:hypothetical protein|uniref:Uncharacterized protein n=1 Tax=Thermocoleostomius sinensis A174 TaxID=2016057 RepID=A0A9E9CB50_9CYAN|nr:hypothetical protein [Thermocoleostomius sinensis]WAL61817.1 hypothetical protein OXH18_07490 [Thermocoleostomius sinensis A174]
MVPPTSIAKMQYNNHYQNLSFLADNQSVASLISQLHQYFKDSTTYCQIDRSTLMGLLETVGPEREQDVLNQIQKLDTELALLEVLQNSLSIADRIIHTKSAITQFGLESPVYTRSNHALNHSTIKV